MALFNRKTPAPEKTTPDALLASAFNASWKAVSGTTGALTFKPMKNGDIPPGSHAVLAYADSNVPVAAFTSGMFRDAESGLDEKLERIARTWLSAAALPAPLSAVCVVSLAGSAREAFLWQVLEHAAYTLSSAPGKNDAALWIAPRFRDLLKMQAETPGRPVQAQQSAAAGGWIRAERPRDLPALDAFCPRSFRFENRGFTTAVRGFAVYAAPQRPSLRMEGPVWFKAAFEYTGKTPGAVPAAVSFYYAFAKQVPSLSGIAGGLFTETVRQFLETAGLAPGRLGLKAAEAMPPVLDAASFVTVDFFVRSSGFSLQAAVFAPAETLALLTGTGGITNTALLRLNAAQLDKNLPSLLRSPELRQKIPKVCVNELFRLLSDQDFTLVIQNVLLPAYGAKELPALLFFTAVAADTPEKEYILPYGPLDGQRLEVAMPDAFREEFFRNTRTLSNRSMESCAALNAQAMQTILEAVRSNRITASPRLAWLMDELVQKEQRAGARDKMEELTRQGIPFALLRALHPKEGQRICAGLDDKDIALALVDCEGELPGLAKVISAAKRQRLAEDVQYYKKLISKGELELAEAVAAKEKIAATVTKETEEEKLS